MEEIDIVQKYYLFNRVQNSDGFHESVARLKEDFDITIHEYAVDDEICHWRIPKRWHVHQGLLRRLDGTIIADFSTHPLYLWAYSHAHKGEVTRTELLENHVFTNMKRPDAIPFRFRQMFRHWESNWGFSLPYNVVQSLTEDRYLVDIDTTFTDDPMVAFEYVAPGSSDDTILIVGHWCHPGIVEDGLSGCSVGLKIIDELRTRAHHYTYKFIGIPELVGAVAYLDRVADPKRIKGSLCLNFVGRDDYPAVFHSLHNRSRIDDMLEHVMQHAQIGYRSAEFKRSPDDSVKGMDRYECLIGKGAGDEAPFEAPGFNIPTTSLVRRTPYRQYHTDQDNPNLVSQRSLQQIREVVLAAFDMLERDWIPGALFRGLPCLSAPEMSLFFSAPRDSNVESQESRAEVSTLARFGRLDYRELNLHDLSTQLVYVLDSGISVFAIAQRFGVPFGFLDDHLQKWMDRGLISKTPYRDVLKPVG